MVFFSELSDRCLLLSHHATPQEKKYHVFVWLRDSFSKVFGKKLFFFKYVFQSMKMAPNMRTSRSDLKILKCEQRNKIIFGCVWNFSC